MADSIYGVGKTRFIKNVEELVRSQVDTIGIAIERIYLIGNMRLPKSVVDAVNSKIEANQRAEQRENELREQVAQAQKDIAKARGDSASIVINAKAAAEAIRIKRQQLNQQIIDYETVKKWNGNLPQVTGSSTPFIDLRKQ